MPNLTASPPEALFAALADRTRLRILCLLRAGETCVCDLVTALRAPQPTVSRHLAHLRRVGLVRCRKDGLWCWYTLAPAAGELHARLLDALEVAERSDRSIQADRRRLTKCTTEEGGCC